MQTKELLDIRKPIALRLGLAFASDYSSKLLLIADVDAVKLFSSKISSRTKTMQTEIQLSS